MSQYPWPKVFVTSRVFDSQHRRKYDFILALRKTAHFFNNLSENNKKQKDIWLRSKHCRTISGSLSFFCKSGERARESLRDLDFCMPPNLKNSFVLYERHLYTSFWKAFARRIDMSPENIHYKIYIRLNRYLFTTEKYLCIFIYRII